jgi:hypothetical protein
MATCPDGHQSAATDYCDECGLRIAPPDRAPAAAAPAAALAPDDLPLSSATQVRPAPTPGEPCPLCKTPRQQGDRYCENDGYDFEEARPIEAQWCVTVSTDRARFDALHPDDLVFPADAPTLTVVLEAESVTVGRRSPSRGIEPDVDLGGGYEDPGVSRRHLRFVRTDDGGYAVVDCGSANGTTVNDDPTSIPPDTPVPLTDGDRVHLGAWTTITLQRQTGGASAT